MISFNIFKCFLINILGNTAMIFVNCNQGENAIIKHYVT